jgi:hypothetical protein
MSTTDDPPTDAADAADSADSDAPDDGTTESVQTRWDYTNDIAALLLVTSFAVAVAGVAVGVATGRITAELPVGQLVIGYLGLVLLAGVWLFGADAFEAISNLRN